MKNLLTTTRRIFSITAFLLFCFIFLATYKSNSFAAATLSLYPDGGTVEEPGKSFTVDVMLSSPTDKITKVSFTLLFDPRYLQITEAQKNNSLFMVWDSSNTDTVYWTIDNDNGIAFLTGFTQSGSGTLYTNASADVLARITFKTLRPGTTKIEWQMTPPSLVCTNFVTEVLADNSPSSAANVLKTEPSPITIKIKGDEPFCGNGVIEDGEFCDTANTCGEGYTCDKCVCVMLPDTAIGIKNYLIYVGLALILLGVFMVYSCPKILVKRTGTVVKVRR